MGGINKNEIKKLFSFYCLDQLFKSTKNWSNLLFTSAAIVCLSIVQKQCINSLTLFYLQMISFLDLLCKNIKTDYYWVKNVMIRWINDKYIINIDFSAPLKIIIFIKIFIFIFLESSILSLRNCGKENFRQKEKQERMTKWLWTREMTRV